ncbi:MAG: hypothetical protein FJ399_10280 [Verrucomicrobia bacterium]|nr:hypothetical protein [Verrucomicrobiota bacterium]
MRGGSFINNPRNARCAYRNRNVPDNFNNNIGFRVCVSIAVRSGRQILPSTGSRTAPQQNSQPDPAPVADPRSPSLVHVLRERGRAGVGAARPNIESARAPCP